MHLPGAMPSSSRLSPAQDSTVRLSARAMDAMVLAILLFAAGSGGPTPLSDSALLHFLYTCRKLITHRSVREARRDVSEMVVGRLSRIPRDLSSPLPPVEMSLEAAEDGTRLRIVSEDTPAFLHA